MFIANTTFACGSQTYRTGDNVPYDLPNNDERLKRGLIREIKTVNPTEVKFNPIEKALANVKRKPKNKTKAAE